MSNNNDLKRRLIAAFPANSWPDWATCIAVDQDGQVYAYGMASTFTLEQEEDLDVLVNRSGAFTSRHKNIGLFDFQADDCWRETLATRQEAEQLLKPEYPADNTIVLIKTTDLNGNIAWAIGYRCDGFWIETSLWGASDVIETPVIDWQYLPKIQSDEQE